MRSIRKRAGVVVIVAWCLVLSGCGAGAARSDHPPMASPTERGAPPSPITAKSYDHTFGPIYAAQPVFGDRLRVEDAVLSQDALTLTVTVVGAHAYAPDNPCSADVDGWVGSDGEALDVAVISFHPVSQAPLTPDVGCTLEGYQHTLHLRLSAPFHGTTVNDVAGNTLWVAAPAGLVVPTILPTGWKLQGSYDEPEARPSLWARVYAAEPVDVNAGGGLGHGRLILFQAFGAATDISIGVPSPTRTAVTVGGRPATVFGSTYSDELLLSFMVGRDGVALDGFAQDFSIAEFARIANGVIRATP